MSVPIGNYFLFSLSAIAATAMLVEGCLTVLFNRPIIPLPTRVLFGLGALVVGKEKSSQLFLGSVSQENRRSYSGYVFILGTLLMVSSFVYFVTQIL